MEASSSEKNNVSFCWKCRCLKHQVAGKVSQNVKGNGKQSKKKAPPDVPPPIPSEADPSLCGTTFPVGPCCLSVNCVGPLLELRKHCPLCEGWVHVPYG